MEKLKELWKKLNLKVAFVGGVIVVTTNLGTCHLMKEGAAPEEAPQEEAVAEEETTEGSEEAPEVPEAEAEEESAEAPTEE